MSASGRVSSRLSAYDFCSDFVLLYPLYALLFAGAGLSTAEIASLFVIWSVTSVIAEVPCGVLADVVPRRMLLTAGPLLRAVGFVAWTTVPSYTSFALGFVLWGVCGAMQSGAKESVVYETLERNGAAAAYAAILGRARACGVVAVLLAMLVAAPTLAFGGYLAITSASVLACVACALVGWGFREPGHRDRDAADVGGWRSYGKVLRSGADQIRLDRAVLRAVLLVAVVTAIWGSLEEYVPLLAASFGVTSTAAPLLVAAVAAGYAVGGMLGALANRIPMRAQGGLLVAATGCAAAGALSGRVWGFALISAAASVFHLVNIAAETRLQQVVATGARATVTSVAGLATDVVGIGVYLGYAVWADHVGHGAAFALCIAAYLVVAAAMARRRRVVSDT